MSKIQQLVETLPLKISSVAYQSWNPGSSPIMTTCIPALFIIVLVITTCIPALLLQFLLLLHVSRLFCYSFCYYYMYPSTFVAVVPSSTLEPPQRKYSSTWTRSRSFCSRTTSWQRRTAHCNSRSTARRRHSPRATPAMRGSARKSRGMAKLVT